MNSDNCNNIPVELLIATSDSKLYDANTQKWTWSGELYWAVECLPNRQYTISDNIPPNISPDQYAVLDKNPATWDYCKSKHCGIYSESMHLVFTFNPHSKDPNDYLQFVFNIDSDSIDSPEHNITDTAGNKLHISIVDISNSNNMAYVEIWIARSHVDKNISPPPLALQSNIVNVTRRSILPIVGILTLIFIIIIILVGSLLSTRSKPVDTGNFIASRNIG